MVTQASATDSQTADDIEVIEYEPATDPHDGRPQLEAYRLRGEALMRQWAEEDAR